MNAKNELEELKFDSELKARNLRTATESVLIDGFNSLFLMKNYLLCKNESIDAVTKLIDHLESQD
jgi:hypothetical protein